MDHLSITFLFKLLSIVILSSVPFLFSLNGDFVFDDSEAIVKNKDVYYNSWTDAFMNDFWGTRINSTFSHKSYRPITVLTFKLNYLLSKQQLIPLHFRITNLICHVVSSLIIWMSFQKLFITKRHYSVWSDEAFLSSLLFSVHPIHVEAVSGIVGRADILASIHFFLAFLSYNKAMHSSSKIQYLYVFITIILAGMSMLCKENGITVFGFCVVYDIISKWRKNKNKKFERVPYKIFIEEKSVLRICLIVVAVLCMLYGRWSVMGSVKPQFKDVDNPAAFSNNTFTKIATYNYIYFLNILLLIWPQWLCYDWSMGCVPLIKTPYDYRIILIIIVLLFGLSVLLALVNQKNRIDTKSQIILSNILMVLPFLPAANIFYAVGFVIAERVLYISSAGYCMLLIIGFMKIKRRFRSKIPNILYCLLLAVFATRSWQRSLQWRNEYSLFTSALSVCPLNAKVHYNVAKAADAKQYTKWALEEYRTAIRLYPDYYQAMNNLANLLKNMKDYMEAEIYLRKSLSIKQDFPAAWMNLGIVFANTKRYKESEVAYRTALKYRRYYPDCYYNLGNLHLELNNGTAAMDAWTEAIKLNPKHNLAWTNILAHLDNTGQIQRALEFIPIAVKELPDSASVNFATANIYGKMERYEDAEKYFLRAIELFGDKVQALHYSNLGVLYHRWKKYRLAKKMYEKSLNIDPNFTSASRNLKSILKFL